MAEVNYRKCNACKQPIEIKSDDIHGVVYYKRLYYHSRCFCELAARRSQENDKRKKPQEWKDALDNVAALEVDTKKMLQQHLIDKAAKDDLNVYLLSQYDVMAVPDRFWLVIAELSNGFYKKKRCKKVSTQTLLEAWKWGQRKLNETARYNKMNHKGPVNDDERILYDLAILVRKIPNYLADKAKNEAIQEEAKTKIVHINYDNIQKVTSEPTGLDDISDLLDEF